MEDIIASGHHGTMRMYYTRNVVRGKRSELAASHTQTWTIDHAYHRHIHTYAAGTLTHKERSGSGFSASAVAIRQLVYWLHFPAACNQATHRHWYRLSVAVGEPLWVLSPLSFPFPLSFVLPSLLSFLPLRLPRHPHTSARHKLSNCSRRVQQLLCPQ